MIAGWWMAALVGAVAGGGMHPTALRCEYRVNPLGTDVAQPRLSWIVESGRRAEKQTAYQIVVAGSEAQVKAGRGDLWDSGKVASDRSAQIVYAGKPLHSGERAWWRVQVWDKNGKAGGFSRPAFWEMGKLAPGDWKGQWIGLPTPITSAKPPAGPAPHLRKTFQISKPVQRARRPADRHADPEGDHGEAGRSVCLRSGAEHGRLGAAEGEGRGGTDRPAAFRRDTEPGRDALCHQPAGREGDRYLYPQGRRRGGL
jgi:hypothetical protein